MFIQISQTILSQMKTHNIETLEAVLKSYTYKDIYVKHFETSQKAAWGTGMFQIETDGTLKLIDSDWDTSD